MTHMTLTDTHNHYFFERNTAVKRITLLLLFCLALMMPFAAQAQKRGEISVFGGFSGTSDIWDSKSGWDVSLAGNVTKHVALVADISRHSSSGSTGWWFGSAPSHSYSYVFGPRYVHTFGQRWTPFAPVLFGAYSETAQGISRTMPALAFGGGLDIRIVDWFSVRVPQIDFVKAKDNDRRFDYGRIAIGAVFRLKGSSK
jgi:hypothetical protein